ncbi:MAG: MBL fold metallo-hydrolase [Candidatus Saccharimonadales bacterium]
MNITKFDHSGFLLEKSGRGLLFDPVAYTHELPEITNLDAIIITHLHGDHFSPQILEKIRAQNPDARVFTTSDNIANIPDATAVKNGDEIEAGVFGLEFYGGNHAAIVSGEVPCENICTLVDGVFANSGGSFDLPPTSPEILLVPITAPWLKIEESLNFIKAVKPKVVIPTHDALNSDLGNTICDNWLKKICDEVGADYKNIHFGEI